MVLITDFVTGVEFQSSDELPMRPSKRSKAEHELKKAFMLHLDDITLMEPHEATRMSPMEYAYWLGWQVLHNDWSRNEVRIYCEGCQAQCLRILKRYSEPEDWSKERWIEEVEFLMRVWKDGLWKVF